MVCFMLIIVMLFMSYGRMLISRVKVNNGPAVHHADIPLSQPHPGAPRGVHTR